jgi:hypothetical protein
VPSHPATHPLDEGQENAAAAVETEAALDVLAHALGPDHQALDQAAGTTHQ